MIDILYLTSCKDPRENKSVNIYREKPPKLNQNYKVETKNEVNINVGNFTPAKKGNKRRLQSTGDAAIDVEMHNGIQGKSKNRPSKAKRHRTKSESETKVDMRKNPVPAHRYTPLKEYWLKIFTLIVEHLQLQIRFNLKTRNVEIRVCDETTDIANLQKGADFVKAFINGFEVHDALALLRLDNLFVETFEIKDVKTLKGDHMSRAIGQLAGKGGRTRIENVTKTRIVLADIKIHILGSFQIIKLARRAICNLILGSSPS